MNNYGRHNTDVSRCHDPYMIVSRGGLRILKKTKNPNNKTNKQKYNGVYAPDVLSLY